MVNAITAAVEAAYATTPPDSTRVTLKDVHAVFARWLGNEYDTDALNAVLATAAVERLDGDPLWLLLLSGSGNAKTETVQALADLPGAIITSTISSPGALLSATSKKERASDATGGLLRRLQPDGVLVVKDVTSILSMDRTMRAEVLAALREVYDGRWSRNVGTDGGRTLDWHGRIALVGAVTTAWDTHHAVVAAMGDRFVIVRMDSRTGRKQAGRQAIANTGNEDRMRADLAAAVAGLMDGMSRQPITLTEFERDLLLAAADTVTLARTAVERDYQGNVIDAHAPEMPTRFAKQLAQIVRGGVAVGMDRHAALNLALRCARDSTPPLRLAILQDLATYSTSTTADVRKRLGKPRSTVDRELQALHQLEMLTCEEEPAIHAGREVIRWHYTVAQDVDVSALEPITAGAEAEGAREEADGAGVPAQTPQDSEPVPEKLVTPPYPLEVGGRREDATHTPTNISGTACHICHQPMDPALAAAGETSHANCGGAW